MPGRMQYLKRHAACGELFTVGQNVVCGHRRYRYANLGGNILFRVRQQFFIQRVYPDLGAIRTL